MRLCSPCTASRSKKRKLCAGPQKIVWSKYLWDCLWGSSTSFSPFSFSFLRLVIRENTLCTCNKTFHSFHLMFPDAQFGKLMVQSIAVPTALTCVANSLNRTLNVIAQKSQGYKMLEACYSSMVLFQINAVLRNCGLWLFLYHFYFLLSDVNFLLLLNGKSRRIANNLRLQVICAV